MWNDEIRQILKTQISDPVPDVISKLFKLDTQDFEIVGTDNEGKPVSRPLSMMQTLGYYEQKLDAIMRMIQLSPMLFKDGKLKEPIACTQIISNYYEIYFIGLDKTTYPYIKTLYILHEMVFD